MISVSVVNRGKLKGVNDAQLAKHKLRHQIYTNPLPAVGSGVGRRGVSRGALRFVGESVVGSVVKTLADLFRRFL